MPNWNVWHLASQSSSCTGSMSRLSTYHRNTCYQTTIHSSTSMRECQCPWNLKSACILPIVTCSSIEALIESTRICHITSACYSNQTNTAWNGSISSGRCLTSSTSRRLWRLNIKSLSRTLPSQVNSSIRQELSTKVHVRRNKSSRSPSRRMFVWSRNSRLKLLESKKRQRKGDTSWQRRS